MREYDENFTLIKDKKKNTNKRKPYDANLFDEIDLSLNMKHYAKFFIK